VEQHLHTPVLIHRVQVLQAQLLDQRDRQLVVSILYQQLYHVFRLVLQKLIVSDCAGKPGRVPQFDQDDGVLHNVDVLLGGKLVRIAEFLRK